MNYAYVPDANPLRTAITNKQHNMPVELTV